MKRAFRRIGRRNLAVTSHQSGPAGSPTTRRTMCGLWAICCWSWSSAVSRRLRAAAWHAKGCRLICLLAAAAVVVVVINASSSSSSAAAADNSRMVTEQRIVFSQVPVLALCPSLLPFIHSQVFPGASSGGLVGGAGQEELAHPGRCGGGHLVQASSRRAPNIC